MDLPGRPIEKQQELTVFNQVFDSGADLGRVLPPKWPSFDFSEEKAIPSKQANFLELLPAMSATVLGLDMLLQEHCVDLRMVSDLVLSDVGATLKILQMIAIEYETVAERPTRMVDCIASLDVNSWFGAISARTFVSDRRHSATTAVWKHSRLVAQYAQLVAESLEGISPEDAYMVGLLHGIGDIPVAMGWPYGDRGRRDQSALLEMEGTLPPFVLNAIRGTSDSSDSSPWGFILNSAHELSGVRAEFEPSSSSGSTSLAIRTH
jgi:hypothetical protein